MWNSVEGEGGGLQGDREVAHGSGRAPSGTCGAVWCERCGVCGVREGVQRNGGAQHHEIGMSRGGGGGRRPEE